MADTLTVDIKASLAWLFQESLDLTTLSDAARLEYLASLADGVGTDQADKLWHDARSVAAASNDDLDLTNLTQVLFGASVSIALAKVKALLIVNLTSGSGATLLLGGAGAGGNAWSAPFNDDPDAELEVPPDSCLLLVNRREGWSVTAGTGDILRVRNPGASTVDYRLALVGTSA